MIFFIYSVEVSRVYPMNFDLIHSQYLHLLLRTHQPIFLRTSFLFLTTLLIALWVELVLTIFKQIWGHLMGHRRLTYQGPQRKVSLLPQQPFTDSTSSAGSMVLRIPLQCWEFDRLDVVYVLCRQLWLQWVDVYTSYVMSRRQPFSTRPATFISYVLYAHSLRCALSMGWGELGLDDPAIAELIVTQRAGICKTEDRPGWILNILVPWPLMPCLLPGLWGNVYCVDLLAWGVLFWLPEPVKTGIYNWCVGMDWSDGPWTFPTRNGWMRGPSGSFHGKSWC